MGVSVVIGGVLLHLPMYIGGRHSGYVLQGMAFDGWMILGMALIAAGYAGVVYGLAPRFGRDARVDPRAIELRALDSSRLTLAHGKLMLALSIAIAIDTQKPFTFTFILPGVAKEYNLNAPAHPAPGHWPVAALPLSGIVGTVLGSLIWGYLGDHIGRRASILLAATVFIGTAMCGAMPTFGANIAVCFVMGLGAGGLLPVAYSLLTEMIPAERRGEVVVLVAGVGTAFGFLFASWSSDWLVPSLSWRIMWLLGLPTGLALLLVNHWIPESPRFLLAKGRRTEALAVLRSFGIEVRERREPAHVGSIEPRQGFATVVRPPCTGLTFALAAYGVAWGLVNFGFLVWMPLHVAKLGVSASDVTAVLAKAALFSVAGSVAVARFYGRWSSKGTLAAAATLEAIVLAGFAGWGDSIVRHTTLFTALVVLLLISMWATISALAPYSAEVYPTRVRSAGAGVAAGASKLGGVVALIIAVAAIAPPDLESAAILGAAPAAIAALLLLRFGTETRGRRLEEIAAATLSESAA